MQNRASEKTNTFFRNILENINIGICIANAENIIDYANAASIEILGIEKNAIINKEVLKTFLLSGIKEFQKKFISAKEKKQQENLVVRLLDSKKEIKYLNVFLIPVINDSDVEGMIISFQNISEIKKVENDLIEINKKLRKAEDIAEYGHYTFDFNTGLVSGSDGAYKIYGLSRKEFTIKEVQKIPLPEYRPMLDEALDNLINKDQPYDVEFKIRRKSDGKIRDIHSIAQFERENNLLIGIIRDITQRKLYEEKLYEKNKEIAAQNEEYAAMNEELQSSLEEIRKINLDLEEARKRAEESDKLKSAFLANMSHEIRTPMNSILGFSDLLSQKFLSDEKRQKYSRLISSSSEQLMRIINDIIDFSKIESGQLEIENERIDLTLLLKDILYTHISSKTYLNKTEVALKLDIPGNNPVIVVVDPVRLKQVFDNLINNALKFTDKGSIEIGCAIEEDKKSVKCFVKDTGIGISAENLENIFDRFYQADNHFHKLGTGLGLSISKGLVELMGGEIIVDSELNNFTDVHFTIPYKEGERLKPSEVDGKFEIHAPDLSGKLFYIAEDHTPSGVLIDELLKETRVEIKHAVNGKELLTLINKKLPDLVILDINMPVMNGLEALKEIRKISKTLPVIGQTAYANSKEKEKCLGAGCHEYIVKPVEKKDLILKILNCLE